MSDGSPTTEYEIRLQNMHFASVGVDVVLMS